MMDTISVRVEGWAFSYCPKCRVVYYNLKECKCDVKVED